MSMPTSQASKSAVPRPIPRLEGLAKIDDEAYWLTGEERKKFLNAYNTQDILKLEAGDVAPGVFLTQKGKIVSPCWIGNLPDKILLLFPRGYGKKVEEHLKTFLLFADVQWTEAPPKSHQAILGDRVPDLLKNLGWEQGEDRPQLALRSFQGEDLILLKTTRLGTLALECVGPPKAVEAFIQSLAQFPALSSFDLENLRVAAAIPKMGVDMSEENLVAEVGLDTQATSFNKGCYLGQETTARVNSMGHVNKKLTELSLEKNYRGPLPQDILQNEKKVGALSSLEPATDGPQRGLGILHRQALEGSDPLTVQSEEGPVVVRRI